MNFLYYFIFLKAFITVEEGMFYEVIKNSMPKSSGILLNLIIDFSGLSSKDFLI
jgi:hypothetical protein